MGMDRYAPMRTLVTHDSAITEVLKGLLNTVTCTWGLIGIYEGVSGFVLNLVQHSWSKDLNSEAWGLKPAQPSVSRLSQLMTNRRADC